MRVLRILGSMVWMLFLFVFGMISAEAVRALAGWESKGHEPVAGVMAVVANLWFKYHFHEKE